MSIVNFTVIAPLQKFPKQQTQRAQSIFAASIIGGLFENLKYKPPITKSQFLFEGILISLKALPKLYFYHCVA
jgi:hypothetical protein